MSTQQHSESKQSVSRKALLQLYGKDHPKSLLRRSSWKEDPRSGVLLSGKYHDRLKKRVGEKNTLKKLLQQRIDQELLYLGNISIVERDIIILDSFLEANPVVRSIDLTGALVSKETTSVIAKLIQKYNILKVIGEDGNVLSQIAAQNAANTQTHQRRLQQEAIRVGFQNWRANLLSHRSDLVLQETTFRNNEINQEEDRQRSLLRTSMKRGHARVVKNHRESLIAEHHESEKLEICKAEFLTRSYLESNWHRLQLNNFSKFESLSRQSIFFFEKKAFTVLTKQCYCSWGMSKVEETSRIKENKLKRISHCENETGHRHGIELEQENENNRYWSMSVQSWDVVLQIECERNQLKELEIEKRNQIENDLETRGFCIIKNIWNVFAQKQLRSHSRSLNVISSREATMRRHISSSYTKMTPPFAALAKLTKQITSIGVGFFALEKQTKELIETLPTCIIHHKNEIHHYITQSDKTGSIAVLQELVIDVEISPDWEDQYNHIVRREADISIKLSEVKSASRYFYEESQTGGTTRSARDDYLAFGEVSKFISSSNPIRILENIYAAKKYLPPASQLKNEKVTVTDFEVIIAPQQTDNVPVHCVEFLFIDSNKIHKADGVWTYRATGDIKSLKQSLEKLTYICTGDPSSCKVQTHAPIFTQELSVSIRIKHGLSDGCSLSCQRVVVNVLQPIFYYPLKNRIIKHECENDSSDLLSGAVVRELLQMENRNLISLEISFCYDPVIHDRLFFRTVRDIHLGESGDIFHSGNDISIGRLDQVGIATTNGGGKISIFLNPQTSYDALCRLFKCVRFSNESCNPILGYREVLVTLTDTLSSSSQVIRVNVSHEDQPTELILVESKSVYNQQSPRFCSPEHRQYFTRGASETLSLFPGCRLLDIDTDFISGGFLVLSITTSCVPGDCLTISNDKTSGVDTTAKGVVSWKGKVIGRLSGTDPRKTSTGAKKVKFLAKSIKLKGFKQQHSSGISLPRMTKGFQLPIRGLDNPPPSWLAKLRLLIICTCFCQRLLVSACQKALKTITILFDKRVSLSSIQGLLRSFRYSNLIEPPKLCTKIVEIYLQLGKTIVINTVAGKQMEGLADEMPSPIVKQISIKIALPMLSVLGARLQHTPTVKYLEGSSAMRIAAFDILHEIDVWDYSHLFIEMVTPPDCDDSLLISERDSIQLVCLSSPPPAGVNIFDSAEGRESVPHIIKESSSRSRPSSRHSNSSNKVSNKSTVQTSDALSDVVRSPTKSIPLPSIKNQPTVTSTLSDRTLDKKVNKIRGKLQGEVQRRLSTQKDFKLLTRVAGEKVAVESERLAKYYELLLEGRFIGWSVVETTPTCAIRIRFTKEVRRRDVVIVLRSLSYFNSSACPNCQQRVLRITTRLGPSVSKLVIGIDLQEVDDITSIHVETSKLFYRPIRDDSENPFLIAPLHRTFVDDPDTPWFDKGHIKVELSNGGHRGDRFEILTTEQQLVQIKNAKRKLISIYAKLHLEDPMKYLFEITEDNRLIFVENGISFATVSYPKTKVALGGHNVVINFKPAYATRLSDDGDSKPCVSMHAVQYLLSCIYFTNPGFLAKSGKQVASTYEIRVGDGINVREGRKRIVISVASPIITLPRMKSSVMIRTGESGSLFPRLLLNLAPNHNFESGYVTITSNCESDVLHFDLSKNSLEGLKLKDGGFYSGANLVALATSITPTLIHLEFSWSCKCSPIVLQEILRSISLRTRSAVSVGSVLLSIALSSSDTRVLTCLVDVNVGK